MKFIRSMLALCLLLSSQAAVASLAFTANNPLSANNSASTFTSGSIWTNYTNTTAGTILYTLMEFSAACTVSAVSDSATNSWTITAGISDGTLKSWLIYANNPSAYSGNDYVTVTFTGCASSAGYLGQQGEVSGGKTSSPVGANNAATGTSGTASVTLSSVVSGSLIAVQISNNSANTITSGGGYTQAFSSNNGTYAYAGEYNLSSGSGSVSATATMTSATWNIIAVAFSPPAGSCTHNFWANTGAFATPNGSTGSYWSISGAWATPNCTSGSYWRSDGTWNSN